jgi:hypothetical protein
MNEIETPRGVLKYRNPNVFENHEFLRSAREFFANDDAIGAKISIMKSMGPLVDVSGLEGVNSYQELCELGEEMTYPLTKIADSILEKVTQAFKKKTSLETPLTSPKKALKGKS